MKPQFFIPNVKPDEQEEAYAGLAKVVRVKPSPQDSRIYSITFRHDGAEWVATVGEQLRGHTIADPRSRAKFRRIERTVGDSALVVAIFASAPYFVFTDGGLTASSRSAWANPFMAGNPSSVSYFASVATP